MWVSDMQDELIEAFRNPFVLVSFLSVFSFCIVGGSAEVVTSVQIELRGYRLQQVELGTSFIGSKGARIGFETVSLDGNFLRKCILVNWEKLVGRSLDPLVKQSVGTGALVVIIPENFDNFTEQQIKAFTDVEQALLRLVTETPVYMILKNDETDALEQEAATRSNFNTALSLIISPSTLLTSMSSAPGTISKYHPKNIVARLSSGDRSAPTLVFVAHYDSHSAFPAAGNGTDSNMSGVITLLELLRVLEKYYEVPSTRPKYNVIFLWTAAGKLNFQGTRNFAESFAKHYPDTKLELAVCVEGLSRPGPFYVHAAKVPSEGTAADRLIEKLKKIHEAEIVTKKININQPLSWEHERFNMKRFPAITVSKFASPDDPLRLSLLDGPARVDNAQLVQNIKLFSEAVLSYVLNLPIESKNTSSHVTSHYALLHPEAIDPFRVDFYIKEFGSHPRPTGDQKKTDLTAHNIKALASAHADVTESSVELSEISIWATSAEIILAERIRPAAFELIIATAVIAYISIFYKFATISHSFVENLSKKLA